MNALHLAELRGSWRSWLSVALAFVVTNLSLALSTLVYFSIEASHAAGRIDEMAALGTSFMAVTNMFLIAVVGIVVLAEATELVIASRRGAIARLALAGATPGQITATLLTQLAAVTLVCSVVGGALALALQGPTLHFVFNQRAEEGLVELDPVISVVPFLLASGGSMVVALLGGFRAASKATRIPAVEALRQAAAEPPVRHRVLRLVAVALLAVVLVAFAAVSMFAIGQAEVQKGDLIVQGGLAIIVLTGLILALGAPVLVEPITRGWTKLVPARGPVWHLARHTASARATRMTKTVVPVMMTVGILGGMLVIGATMEVLIKQKWGEDSEMNGGTLGSLLMVMGLPFLVSLSGAVGNLIMMTRQRDAELALTGISGATPEQQRGLLVLEGVIVAVTGTLLGVLMVAGGQTFISVGMSLYSPVSGLRIPWGDLAVVLAGVIAICVATTTLPSLATLRKPPQRVVARLIAD